MSTSITPEQGLLDLEQCYRTEVSAGWLFIRKLAAYVDAFGPAYYYQVADHMGLSPKSLRDYASVARSPISHYAEQLGLSRTHAQAVLGLPEEEAKSLLLRAAEEGLSADWVRFEARTNKASRGLDAVKPTGAPQMNGSNGHSQTHQPTTPNAPAPQSVAREEGYNYTEDIDDDVPFGLPPDPVSVEELPFAALIEPVRPFDVAEYIIKRWGKAFFDEVVAEGGRWW